VTLLNDQIFGNAGGGVFSANASAAVANLTINDSSIHDNIGPGITLQDGVLSAMLLNDQVYNNTGSEGDGIDAVQFR